MPKDVIGGFIGKILIFILAIGLGVTLLVDN